MHKPDQELFLLYLFHIKNGGFSLEEDGELTHVILYDMTQTVQIPDSYTFPS